MYLAMAYALGIFTAMMVALLLWMGWEHRRDEARAERAKKLPREISS